MADHGKISIKQGVGHRRVILLKLVSSFWERRILLLGKMLEAFSRSEYGVESESASRVVLWRI